MGRAFTYDDLIAKQVPDQRDFDIVSDVFKAHIQEAIDANLVHGALVYGSVGAGNPGPRSDKDVLAVHDGSDEGFEVVRFVVAASSQAVESRIPIHAISYSADVLSSGNHEIDRFFGEHLTKGKRLVYGTDPAEYLRHADSPAYFIFEEYLRNKIRRLADAYVSPDPTKELEGIQRLLEAPLATGRKLGQVLDELEGTERISVQNGDKQSMTFAVLTIFEKLGVYEPAAKILAADADYSVQMVRVMNGEMSRKDYEDYIAELRSLLIHGIRWLNAVDIAFGEQTAKFR